MTQHATVIRIYKEHVYSATTIIAHSYIKLPLTDITATELNPQKAQRRHHGQNCRPTSMAQHT